MRNVLANLHHQLQNKNSPLSRGLYLYNLKGNHTMNSLKAVIYARYSSDKQRDESIEGQIRECRAFAEREGIIITNIYTDKALSARTDNRPKFLQMIEDSKKHLFDYVLVYQLDRFSRSREDSAVYKAILKKNGVKVVSAKENITNDPAGIILESVLEGMAEYYSAELSQKVRRGMTDNALQGKVNGTPTPLGYDKTEDKRLIINEREARIVRTIFDLYIKGHSIPSICSHLNSKGYLSKHGSKFSYAVVRRILSNEKYIGTMRWNDIVIENAIPSIISKDIFDKVQHEKGHRIKKKGARSEFYNLCGKLYCGKCGGHYTGNTATSHTGAKHHYYSCTNRRKHKTCTGKNIKRDILEDIIINQTIHILNEPNTIAQLAKMATEASSTMLGDAELELKRIDVRIKELQSELENYMKAIAKGFISDTLQAQIENAEAELQDHMTRKANHEIKAQPIKLTAEHIEFFLYKMAKENPTTNTGRARILDTFIHSATIYDDRVEITFNYNNDLPQFKGQVIDGSFSVDVVVQMTQKANLFQFLNHKYPLRLIMPL